MQKLRILQGCFFLEIKSHPPYVFPQFRQKKNTCCALFYFRFPQKPVLGKKYPTWEETEGLFQHTQYADEIPLNEFKTARWKKAKAAFRDSKLQ